MKTLGMEREWRRRYASNAGLKRGKMGRTASFLKPLIRSFGIGLGLADAEVLQLLAHGLTGNFQPPGCLGLISVRDFVGAGEKAAFHRLENFRVHVEVGVCLRELEKFLNEGFEGACRACTR
jgi:hypothetical protein